MATIDPDWEISMLYSAPCDDEMEFLRILQDLDLSEVHPFVPLRGGNGMFWTYLMIGGVDFRLVVLNGESLRKVMLNTFDAGKKPVIVTLGGSEVPLHKLLELPELVDAYLAGNPNAESNQPVYSLDIPYESLFRTHD